jgi:syntaxin 16
MLNGCHTSVQQISVHANKSQTNTYDKRLSSNVVQATASALQDLTIKFRKCQSAYLHKLKSRKENFNRIMPDLEIDMHSNPFGDQNDPDKNFDQISLTSEDQLQLTTQNVEYLEKRDKEIREVLRSIEDVNEIFRDVAQLISNQGTILDQIEYNIETTVVQLEQGNKHLAKAVEHKQRGLKFKLIILGVCLSVLFFIIFVGVITR